MSKKNGKKNGNKNGEALNIEELGLEELKESFPTVDGLETKLAFRVVKRLAELGEPEQCRKLANMYAEGAGCRVSLINSRKCLERAAELGDAEAYAELALIHQKGEGVPRNYDKAFDCAKKAVDAGSDLSLVLLSNYYLQGIGVEADPQKGFECMERAADKGVQGARTNLGSLLLEGAYGVPKNIDEALRHLKLADEAHDYTATWILGDLHNSEDFPYRDPKKAADYLVRALTNGSLEALWSLGELNKDGEDRDYDTGLDRFEVLSALGQPVAMGFLGMRKLSQAKKKNDETLANEGEELIRKSAENGFVPAIRELGVICIDKWRKAGSRDEDSNLVLGVNYLTRATDHGDVEAAYQVGKIHEFLPEIITKEQAAMYWNLAANAGHKKAKEELEKLVPALAGTEDGTTEES